MAEDEVGRSDVGLVMIGFAEDEQTILVSITIASISNLIATVAKAVSTWLSSGEVINSILRTHIVVVRRSSIL